MAASAPERLRSTVHGSGAAAAMGVCVCDKLIPLILIVVFAIITAKGIAITIVVTVNRNINYYDGKDYLLSTLVVPRANVMIIVTIITI